MRIVRYPLEQLQPYLIEVSNEPALLDFGELFGNTRPVELEVGFGKGLFLVSASETHPDINFLGMELERKYYLYTATRLAKRNRSNVRVICGDARRLMPALIRDSSLQGVHVYFPDPWWKTRHRKRRLFNEDFARQCQRILRPGGILHVVSDVQEYYQTITALLTSFDQLESIPPPDPKTPQHDLDYLTNFDRKYRKEGRPIYRARYLRK